MDKYCRIQKKVSLVYWPKGAYVPSEETGSTYPRQVEHQSPEIAKWPSNYFEEVNQEKFASYYG
jgi:hypothetical protein